MESLGQHHAYLYYGDAAVVGGLRERLATTGVVSVYEHERWGIDESRTLSIEAHRTDEIGRARHFVLAIGSITSEAQNALLKLFEEPPMRVVFHCVVPPGTSLLPTLRSRLLPGTVTTEVGVDDDATVVYETLIRLPLSEQLAEVDARTKKKDAVWIDAVRRGGLRAVAAQTQNTSSVGTLTRLYETLLLVGSRGAANKMLLEDVVLSVASFRKQR